MPPPRSTEEKLRCLGLAAAVALSAVAAVAPPAGAADTGPTAWERAPAAPPVPDTCQAIDPVFVISVRAAERAMAVAQLEQVSVIPIDLAQVARLGFEYPPPAETLHYQKRLRQEIDDQQARRLRILEQGGEIWPLREEQRLRDLVDRYHDDAAPPLFPYLVRAVANTETIGRFSARLCAGDLWIDHQSPAGADPAALRSALVIYLAQRPRRVFVTRTTVD